MTSNYTAQLEARAAYYAALTLDVEGRLDDVQTLRDEMRLEAWLERIEAKVDADGLGALVDDARDVLMGDAERVTEIIAAGKPQMPCQYCNGQ